MKSELYARMPILYMYKYLYALIYVTLILYIKINLKLNPILIKYFSRVN